jgi:glycosyltransferase involved in cell wall biosynthesis
MSAGPLISIVTPSLNQGRLISACLQSVATQSYPNLEHIVVDGGSTDETLKILEDWSTSSDRRFLSEPDSGMYDALNKGFRLARGEFFAYLNTDDLYFAYALAALVGTLQETAADIVYGDTIIHYLDDGRTRIKHHPEFDSGFWGYYYHFHQPGTMWRRELWHRLGGFDASLRYAADTEFFLRAARAESKFVRTDEIICVDRHRRESLSAAHRAAHEREIALARRRHGEWRSVAERGLVGPLRVVRALAHQAQLAACFTREFRKESPSRWKNFLAGGYLADFSPSSHLFNVLPYPLARTKRSIGSLHWPGILRIASENN